MIRPIGMLLTLAVLLATSTTGWAAHKWRLTTGTPDLRSAGQLALGPDGILFVGDSKGAAIFAIDTGDATTVAPKPPVNVENLTEQLSAAAGGTKTQVRDLIVNPLSGTVYLSLSKGESEEPALARVDAEGKVSLLSLENVPFLKATLPNPPEDKITGEGPRAKNRRNEAITDLAFTDGRLLVAGLTEGVAPSAVLQYPFPFGETAAGTNVEIYHAAHGRTEDYAAIRTFIPLTVNGEATLLAGFTCTPLVRFDVKSLQPGSKSRGTTVAELGNRNTPLDLIAYSQGGEGYLLVTNTSRGVLKVSTQDIGRDEGLTSPVKDGGTAGQPFERIATLEGTLQLDKLNEDQAVVVIQHDAGLSLRTIDLP